MSVLGAREAVRIDVVPGSPRLACRGGGEFRRDVFDGESGGVPQIG